MHVNNHDPYDEMILLAVPFLLALITYIMAAFISSRRHKKWPLYRAAFWVLGVLFASAAVIGPLANRSHTDFTAHMLGHLLLGMLAPLFIVLSAPMTLLLRTLPVDSARCLSRLLKSWAGRILSDPAVASFLNVGGMWLLYTTNLYNLMQQNAFWHIGIHTHMFLAGYLFIASIIYIDPIPHRTSFVYRSAVLVIASAGHGMLSKYIYGHPPGYVSRVQAEKGGQLMYYGGDAIGLVLIFLFCFQWFKASRPRASLAKLPVNYEHGMKR